MLRSVLTLRRSMNSEPSSHENLRDFNLRQSLWTNTQDRERLSISAPPLPRYWSYRLPFTLAGSRVVHASAAYLNLVHPASISSKSIWISPNSWDPLRPAMCKLSKIQGLWRLGPQSGLCHSGHQLFMVSGMGHHFKLVRWSLSVTSWFSVLISDLLIIIRAPAFSVVHIMPVQVYKLP